jgi:hypothetical protein
VSSVFDLSGVVLDLASGSYTVTRGSPTTGGTDGRAVVASPSTFSIKASVQPLNGRDLLRLPEGERSTERVKVYSPTQLFTTGAGQVADLISVLGISYEVETAQVWGPNGNFWKMICRAVRRSAP